MQLIFPASFAHVPKLNVSPYLTNVNGNANVDELRLRNLLSTFSRAAAAKLNQAHETSTLSCRLRPYHVESTGSRPITEVKQRRARLVLGWVTAWEYRVS